MFLKNLVPVLLLTTTLGGFALAESDRDGGSRIAFVQGPDVYTMKPDGTDVRQLTHVGANTAALWASWSPDAKQIIFAEFPPTGPSQLWLMNADQNTAIPSAIYVINLDGNDLRQLTRPGTSSDVSPGYSPDGKKIVFISNRMSSDQSFDLFTMNADGSDVRRIASGLTVGGCPDENCVDPSWGPKPKQ